MTYTWNEHALDTPLCLVWTGSSDFAHRREVKRARRMLEEYSWYEYSMADMDASELINMVQDKNPFLIDPSAYVVYDGGGCMSEESVHAFVSSMGDKDVALVRGEGAWPDHGDEVFKTDTLSEQDAPAWLSSYVSSLGYELSERLASLVVKNVGVSRYSLSNEARKFIMYHDDGQDCHIASDDVQSVLYRHTGVHPSDIVSAWSEKKTSLAFRRLDDFYDHSSSDPSFFLLGFFLRRVERMIVIKSALSHDDASLLSTWDTPSWLVQNIKPCVSHWSIGRLKDAYRRLSEMDTLIKEGRSGRLLFESMLIHTMQEFQG
jgi:hypothetical protein